MVKFSKYDIFHKKWFWGVDFIFLITLVNKPNVDKHNNGFEVHTLYFTLKKVS